MKKVLLALILVALVLVPATAATDGAAKSDLAVGLNLWYQYRCRCTVSYG